MTNSLSDSKKSELAPDEVWGVQTPSTSIQCPQVGDYADEAAFLTSSYGLTPDPWQMHVLRNWLGYREDGKWAHSKCGLSVPRQNGKNCVIEIREIFGMVALGEHILHTAHEVKTARKAFKRLQHFFGNKANDPDAAFPELNALVKEVRNTNGQEAIVLWKDANDHTKGEGGSVEFVARSNGSARGFTIDIVVMDEAQHMNDDSLEALGPTTRAAPTKNRQFIWTGTPPKPEETGEVFTRIRTQSLERRTRMCWDEWAMDDDGDPNDVQQWLKANPAIGYRLTLEEVEEDRDTYSDEGFARECGGCWRFAGTGAVIDPDSWSRVGDGSSVITDPVAFALDIGPKRDSASIAVAGARADGIYHVEVIDNRMGTDWVLPRLTQLVAQWQPVAVVVDGPASSVVPELESLRVPVYKTTPNELGAACGMFYDAVMGRTLRHVNQSLLTSAIDSARQRPLGDMWAWGRKLTETDITPVVAVTLALYGFVTAKPVAKKGRGRVVGNRTTGNRTAGNRRGAVR